MWMLLQRHDGVKFHSAGREDMDVRMLGQGRPFVLEVINARISPLESACLVRACLFL